MFGKKAFEGSWSEMIGWALLVIIIVIIMGIILGGAKLLDLSFLDRIG